MAAKFNKKLGEDSSNFDMFFRSGGRKTSKTTGVEMEFAPGGWTSMFFWCWWKHMKRWTLEQSSMGRMWPLLKTEILAFHLQQTTYLVENAAKKGVGATNEP